MPPTTLATPQDDETAATAVRDPLLEMQLGEYVVKRRLGQGGMGVVYAGLQPIIQKPRSCSPTPAGAAPTRSRG